MASNYLRCIEAMSKTQAISSDKGMKPTAIYCPDTLLECFSFDDSETNPTPYPWSFRIRSVVWPRSSRYPMTVTMRLSQWFDVRSRTHRGVIRRLSWKISAWLRQRNLTLFSFEHGAYPMIEAGIIFHHTGVCITSDTVIESGVHIYRNVTFGIKNGHSPVIKKGAKIASHSIVIGATVIGERAIVAPGAAVVDLVVPDGKIAAGVPARIVGDVTDNNYYAF